jgi:hypothetical protein
MRFCKLLLCIISCLFTVCFTTALWREWTDNRPFKFEKYKSSKELELGLLDRFPLGSDADAALKILQESGGKCEVFYGPNDLASKGSEYLISCWYITDFISFHTLESYRLYIYGDKQKLIVSHWATRHTGLILVFP